MKSTIRSFFLDFKKRKKEKENSAGDARVIFRLEILRANLLIITNFALSIFFSLFPIPMLEGVIDVPYWTQLASDTMYSFEQALVRPRIYGKFQTNLFRNPK